MEKPQRAPRRIKKEWCNVALYLYSTLYLKDINLVLTLKEDKVWLVQHKEFLGSGKYDVVTYIMNNIQDFQGNGIISGESF